MPEMNPVSRFFVNLSARRRAARNYRWIRQEVPIPPGAACLEVGCGNGSLAAQILEGFHPSLYVATDVDPRQVESARRELSRRYPSGLPAALLLQQADMLHLPFADHSFDVVFAFVAIHHASATHEDYSRVPDALAELTRVLRPVGCLVYQEIFHKVRIREWLLGHGYSIERFRSQWRRESVAARRGPVPPPTAA